MNDEGNTLINPEDDKYTNLEHLNESQLQELIQKFYEGGIKIKDILVEYNLDISEKRLSTFFPLMRLFDHLCDYCGCPTETQYGPKYSKNRYMRYAFCPLCKHRPFDQDCGCHNCKEKYIKQEQLKKQKINEMYSVKKNPKAVATLSLIDRVYLGAIFYAMYNVHTKKITPLKASSEQLAPTAEFAERIIEKLLEDDVISVDPQSPISAFTNDDFPYKYKKTEVFYCINVDAETSSKREFFEQLLPDEYIIANREKIMKLWYDIAVEECIAYLMSELTKMHFDYRPGKDTRNKIEELLVNFSIAQVFSLIWNAKKFVATLYCEHKITRSYAANCVLSTTMKNAQMAMERDWKITNYYRPSDMQQNAIAYIILNDCLCIGTKGYTEKLNDL